MGLRGGGKCCDWIGCREASSPHPSPTSPPPPQQWKSGAPESSPQPPPGSRKVGIAWAGRPEHKQDRQRTVRLAEFAPLASIPDLTLFSLQKGPAAAEANPPPPGLRVVNLTAGLADFADTAAFIANLDLVIAVDTVIVHLAGAMGKPVWTLIQHLPDFRWLLGRDDSPWYPTMRLFRQPAPGDWVSVFQQVATQLRRG